MSGEASTTTAGTLRTGDLIGMVALTANQPHEFSARAVVYSEMLYLEKEVYEELSKESEKFQELIEMEAIKQENLISRAKKNLARSQKLGRMGDETGTVSPMHGEGRTHKQALRSKMMAVGRLKLMLSNRAAEKAAPPPAKASTSKVVPEEDDEDEAGDDA